VIKELSVSYTTGEVIPLKQPKMRCYCTSNSNVASIPIYFAFSSMFARFGCVTLQSSVFLSQL